MYIKKQMEIQMTDVDRILAKVNKVSERLDDSLELLRLVSSAVIHLNVDVYDTVDGPKFMVGFSDIKESAARLRCIIHELEEILGVFESLPSEVARMQKKISQPKES